MSILVKEDYANPTTPLWATTDQLVALLEFVPRWKDGSTSSLNYGATDTNENLIYAWTEGSLPTRNGNYVINATWNWRSLASGTPTTCVGAVKVAPTTSLAQAVVIAPTGEDMSSSVNITYPYVVGDSPLQMGIYEQVSDDNSQTVSVDITWSVIFYPTI